MDDRTERSALVERGYAGFEILERSVASQYEGDHEVAYLWVLAQRR